MSKASTSAALHFFPVLDDAEDEIDGSSADDSEDSEEDNSVLNDGEGIGIEDEGDSEDEDSGDGYKEDRGMSKFMPFLCSCFVCLMPPWLEDPFKWLLLESSNHDKKGLPLLYSVHKTFFFPKLSTFFLLRDGVTPTELFNPQFALWDPIMLCEIPCPNCSFKLQQYSEIPCPQHVVDLDTSFWIIGY